MNLRTAVTCLLITPVLLLTLAAAHPEAAQDGVDDGSLELAKLRTENLALKQEVMRLEKALFRRGAAEPVEATIPRIENWNQHRYLE